MKKKISIVLNVLIIVFEIVGLIVTYKLNKRISIEYYTEDSNILTMFSSLIYVIFLIKNDKLPKWAEMFKYMTTICLTVTFLVVLFILSPMYNFNYLYLLTHGSLLYQHLLCPIFSIVTFIFFDKLNKYDIKDSFKGNSLTIIYAFILIILNIFRKTEGPYPFLMVYNQSTLMSIIWFIAIIGLSYLIGLILRILFLKFNIRGGNNYENRRI